MSDPRLHLAAALRAAGLTEKANEILSEIVKEQTGIRPVNEIQTDLDNTFANFREVLGMRPKRRKAKNPKPTVKERLIVLLEEAGVRELDNWKISKGFWLRDQQDVMRWECSAQHWNDLEAPKLGFHVGSWSSMSDCVKYGITVVDGEKHGGGYCTISVEAKYPTKSKT